MNKIHKMKTRKCAIIILSIPSKKTPFGLVLPFQGGFDKLKPVPVPWFRISESA